MNANKMLHMILIDTITNDISEVRDIFILLNTTIEEQQYLFDYIEINVNNKVINICDSNLVLDTALKKTQNKKKEFWVLYNYFSNYYFNIY